MTTAKLSIEIRFDPDITDADSLAAAMDQLLETTLSTPGILEDYGNPALGDFYVVNDCMQAETQSNVQKTFCLRIDGPTFRSQRELLLKLRELVSADIPYSASPHDQGRLEGLIELTDALADQAHDQYGIDCLLDAGVAPCDCEKPGHFCSGVPGILARMENGRLAPGAKVERCDLCRRYPSDEAAAEKLRQLSHGRP